MFALTVLCVVFLSLSTSNHNTDNIYVNYFGLYFFPYLHQTTTFLKVLFAIGELYFFPYLHQTTTQATELIQTS